MSDDSELVRRALAADSQAFYVLVSRYERSVYWVAYGMLGNAADAEEVAQEAFLKCFQNLGQFRGESKFSTWLIQIAVNEARQRLRRQRPAVEEPLDTIDTDGAWMPHDFADWRHDPEEEYAREEVRRIVDDAVASLPAPYRVVLIMRDLEQMSNEEVAEALGLSLTATKSRVLRARLQLREKLAQHFGHNVETPGWWRRFVNLAGRLRPTRLR